MIRYIPAVLFLGVCAIQANAEELVHDTQAFIYYKIPLGGNTASDRAHQYGFRMDHSWVDQDRPIDMNQVMSRPGVIDFRMSSRDQARFEIHGADYLQKYLASRADAGDSESAETEVPTEVTEDAPADGGTTAQAEPAAGEETEKGFGDEMMDSLTDVPLGIYIGLGILGAIVAGG